MKQAPATPQSLEICYLMSAEWAAFKALNWTQSVLRYVLKTPLVSPPPCHTRSLSMSMQDSLHPWMTNPAGSGRRFSVSSVDDEKSMAQGLALLSAQPIEVQFCLDARGLCHDI
jgi:hypothetical protein